MLSKTWGALALRLLSGVEQASCVQMSLVYRKSTKSIARKYERSPGMEPNTGGVSHMTVINPGAPRSNPFQWIKGRGRNHRHLSPPYRTMQGAKGWAEKHADEPRARLVAVDEYGTIVTRPLSRKQVLRNPGSRSMAYNLSALRAAMRRNAGRGIDGGQFFRTSSSAGSASGGGAPSKPAKASKPSRSKKTSGAKVKGAKVTAKKATSKKTATAKGAKAASKSASTQAKTAVKAASKAKKATSKKAASAAAKTAVKAASKAKKAASKATSKAKKAKPSSKKAANAAAAKARREAKKAAAAATEAKRASARKMSRGRISGKMGALKLKGSPYRTGRLFNPPFIHVTGFERVKKGSKRTSRRISKKKKMVANLLARTGHSRGMPSGRRVQVVEFGPRSKRKGYAVYVPGHVTERAYVRKFKFGGAAKRAHSRAMQFGYSKKRYSKKPVTANGRSSMRRNSKRHSRRHSVKRNSKRHSRRLRGNRYVVVKNRRRMRRNVTIFGVDPITQVAIPGAYALGGLVAANAAANLAARVPMITNVLDAGRADPIVTKSLIGAAAAGLTVAFGGRLPSMLRSNLGPIVAGMGCAVAVRLLRGQATIAPYLGSWGAGFGEYVDQPLGAYVQDPSMGEYVDQSLGEYVDQPLGGLGSPTLYAAAGYPEGVDPADQGGIDGLMDVAEAAAGVGAFEAAAGMGTFYAAAGLGAGEMGVTGSPIPVATFTPPVGPGGNQQPPFVSIQDPIDQAKRVTGVMRRDLPIPTSMVTPEGRGSAGGIFSRSIFGGMMS